MGFNTIFLLAEVTSYAEVWIEIDEINDFVTSI